MYDAKQVIEILSKLDTGDGLFRGDPLYLLSDGSVIDKDGNQIAKPSQLGADKYNAHTGFVKHANPTATVRGGIFASAKGAGDTVEVKIGTDGKLYVPAYPTDAQFDLTSFITEVDSVASSKPVAYNDGDLWVDEGAAKIYEVVDGAWVEITTNKVVEATTAPAIYDDGDIWVDTGTNKWYLATSGAWVEITANKVIESSPEPTVYAVGDHYIPSGAAEVYTDVANAWVKSAFKLTKATTAPTLYANGDYWVKDGQGELYQVVNGAWSLVTDALTEATEAPATPSVGDWFLDTDTDTLAYYAQSEWVEITVETVVVVGTEPVLYVDGDFFLDTDDNTLYVLASGTWGAATGTTVVAASAPALYVDGDGWLDTDDSTLHILASGTWGDYSDSTVVYNATEPVIYNEGDYFLDTDTSDKLYKVVEGSWVEQTTMQHIQTAEAPTLYALGFLLADQGTKKIYEREETDWDAGTSLAAGKFYTDGTDIYVFGSGSLAKI